MSAIKMISAEAKKIRKKYPYKDWKNCIKEASAIYRSKNKINGVKKTAKKAAKKAVKKAVKKSPARSLHKDTKSHNVNIRVISGIGSYNDPEKVLYEIEFWQKQLDKLRNEYKSPQGKQYKNSITLDIRMAKKWLELNKNKLKKIINLKK